MTSAGTKQLRMHSRTCWWVCKWTMSAMKRSQKTHHFHKSTAGRKHDCWATCLNLNHLWQQTQSAVLSWVTVGCSDILTSLFPALNTVFLKTMPFHQLWQPCKYLSRIFRSFEEGLYHWREELKSFGLGWRNKIPSFCRFSNAAFCFLTTTETCCHVCFSTHYTFLAFTLCSPLFPLFEWQSDVSYAPFYLWARTKRSYNPYPNISFRW